MRIQIKRIAPILVLAIAGVVSSYATNALTLRLDMETDPELELEAWMVQDKYWTNQLEAAPDETEEELVIEPWMIDDCYWK